MNRCCSPIPPALSRKPGLTFNAGLRRHYHRPKRVECGQKPAYRRRYGDLYQRPHQLTFAHGRWVIEAIALGSLAKKFQALQQASTMSS